MEGKQNKNRLIADALPAAFVGRELSNTYRNHLNLTVRVFGSWLGRPATVADLTAANLEAFGVWLRPLLEPITVRNHCVSFRAVWRRIHEAGFSCEKPPAMKIARYKAPNYAEPEGGLTLARYFDEVYRRQRFISIGTASLYREALARLANYLNRLPLVGEVTESMLQGFANWRLAQGRSVTTVAKERGKLATLAAYHKREQAALRAGREVLC